MKKNNEGRENDKIIHTNAGDDFQKLPISFQNHQLWLKTCWWKTMQERLWSTHMQDSVVILKPKCLTRGCCSNLYISYEFILENVGDDSIFFIELHDIQNVWMIDSMIRALFKQVGLVVDVSNGLRKWPRKQLKTCFSKNRKHAEQMFKSGNGRKTWKNQFINLEKRHKLKSVWTKFRESFACKCKCGVGAALATKNTIYIYIL